MKHLVETNLENVGSFDFRELYTDDVKKKQYDYAYGKDGSSPEAEQNYVMDKFRASVAELPDEVTVLQRYDIDAYLSKGYKKIHVDCKVGSDENDGGENTPVATIAQALSLASGGAVAIVVHAGDYSIPDTLCIDKRHSGTADTPFILTSAGDGEVLISLAKKIEFSDLSPIEPDDEIAARLPEPVKGKVLFADLKKKGWTDAQIGGITTFDKLEDIGVVKKFRSPTLYVDGVPMDLARYPNSSENRYDLLYFDKVADSGSVIDRDGSCLYLWWIARVRYYVEYKDYLAGKGEKPSWERKYLRVGREFPLYKSEQEARADYEKLAAREKEGYAPFVDKYGNYNMDMGFTIRMSPNDQPKADARSTQTDMDTISEWKSIYDRDVMIFGNAYSGWDYNRYRVKSVEKREDGYCYLTTKGGSSWGAMTSANSPTGHNTYHFYNAIEALDTEGEWYVDGVTGRLYIYPTEKMKTARIEYSANVCDAVKITADNVIINGIRFDKGMSRGIYACDCEGVVLQGCELTAMNNEAVLFENTTRCAIIRNAFRHNKFSSVNIYGERYAERGERQLNIVQNNVIDEPIDNQTAINICGYMNCASHNLLYMTNITIGGGGRYSFENIVEYNDISGGNTSTSDAGLIYTNQLYARGTHIRYNYMHNWHASGNGVYFDDLNSGNYAYYNIIDTTDAPGKKARGFIYSSSGHGHMMYNNLCIGRTQIFEDGNDADGNYRERTYTGTIASKIGERTPDGKYPFIVTVDGVTHTVMTEMTDRDTSFLYVGDTVTEDGVRLEVWSIKTHSDDEGDYVSVAWNYKDGSKRRCINYNDKINQAWMYFSDTCHLGYRFRGFAEKFCRELAGFAKAGTPFERRFPELITHMDMYKEYLRASSADGYRIDPLEIFVRSTAMNNVVNNIVAGVARPFDRGQAESGVDGVDAYGREKLHVSVNTDVYKGNFDCTSEGYEAVREEIVAYQEKPTQSDFRCVMQALEAEQKKQNPSYRSIAFVLDRVGLTK